MKCTNPDCRNYGRELAPGARFCGVCGTVVAEGRGTGSAGYAAAAGTESTSRGTAARGSGMPAARRSFSLSVNRMPQGIALGSDEQVVKQYSIGRYTFRQGTIDVIVTNKRVIRYEESSLFGMQNNQIDEMNIDAVHGNYTRMRRSISILGLTGALFLIAAGLFGLLGNFGYRYQSPLQTAIGIAALALAAGVIILSLKPTLEFGLLGAVGGGALRTVVNNRGRMMRNDSNSVIMQFKPTGETTVMLKEIGACIYDLKTLGDRAIEKWQ